MVAQHKIEFIVGLFMIAGMIAFAVLAFKVSGLMFLAHDQTYQVTAEFEHIGDLKVRAPVTIAGVQIGRITKIDLDEETFRAVVTLAIGEHNRIPKDSTANIFTAGLIGSNYISIVPGFEEEYLKDGDRIENTNQALILQNIIGQLVFNLNKDNKDEEKEK